jgi:uncharacterized protein
LVDPNNYTLHKDWLAFQNSSKVYKAWQGYAFENICIKHAEAVKNQLGIGGINTSIYSYWKQGTTSSKGFQIDMIIDRADNTINLCEMKFYNKQLQVTSKLAEQLRIKRATFIELTATKKTVFNTVISTFGLDKTEYQSSEIDSEVQMKDLFSLTHF